MGGIKSFISYWYMRYLLVTELFMVNSWERRLFHVLAFVTLLVLGLFNQWFVVGAVRYLRQFYQIGLIQMNPQDEAVIELKTH